MWANNPVLPAIAEAVGPLEIPIDRIDVLSVGTLVSEPDFSTALGGGKLTWAKSVSNLFFAAQQSAASMLTGHLLSQARHLRVNEQTSRDIPLDDVTSIEEMARRGVNKAIDAFASVSSRFLDGYHVPDWRKPVV